ncbi:MAG: IS5/IS1182 family transposase, partial [Syntrophobacterales bacterium CG23_combo_of_CG06-09_8_20_14_all_48_27]
MNAVMENRNRIIVGIGVESPQGLTAERQGVLKILRKVKQRLKLKPKTLGADKGFFEKKFIRSIFKRKIEPHIAIQEKGS